LLVRQLLCLGKFAGREAYGVVGIFDPDLGVFGAVVDDEAGPAGWQGAMRCAIYRKAGE
jgi:hypothetical protein